MILNRQRKVRVSLRPLQSFLVKLARELHLDISEMTVAFVTNTEIAGMNKRFRRKKGPTDVLSFPSHARQAVRKSPLGSRKQFVSGDVAIAPETARKYARKNGRSLSAELRILILHGLLHLLGYDHESDQGQMDRIEQRLRRRFGLA
jgi:probable rRNA maturation factor